MKIIIKKSVASIPKKVTVTILCLLCALFFTPTGCDKQKSVSQENDDCIEGLGWGVRLKLKPHADESYLATEDPEMMALVAEHDVIFYQTYPNPRSTPKLLLYYDLIVKGGRGKESSKSIVKDFLSTGKFENDVHEYGISSISSCTKPATVNDPDFNNEHGWTLKMIDAPCAWAITKGNPNILIGIADSEFDTTHEDLQNKFASVTGPVTFDNHHGTKVIKYCCRSNQQ